MRLKTIYFVTGILTACAAANSASADSCMPLLTSLLKQSNSIGINIVTLNNLRAEYKSFASFTYGSVTYVKPIPPAPNKPGSPALLVSSDDLKQQFSDRANFDINQADKISMSMSVADSPSVRLTLKSWNNGVLTFPVTCSSNNVMHGVARDADYLISLFLTSAPIQ